MSQTYVPTSLSEALGVIRDPEGNHSRKVGRAEGERVLSKVEGS